MHPLFEAKFVNQGGAGPGYSNLVVNPMPGFGPGSVEIQLNGSSKTCILQCESVAEMAFAMLEAQSSTLSRTQVWSLIERLMEFRAKLETA